MIKLKKQRRQKNINRKTKTKKIQIKLKELLWPLVWKDILFRVGRDSLWKLFSILKADIIMKLPLIYHNCKRRRNRLSKYPNLKNNKANQNKKIKKSKNLRIKNNNSNTPLMVLYLLAPI